MINLRLYGTAPFTIALIHGGPGAGGEMAPVARELAAEFGILEPIQTAQTLNGQVEELRSVLVQHADLPVTLVGYSWGAWLSYLLAARYPALVRKLILISSGPFEQKYVAELQATRFNRLTPAEQQEFSAIITALGVPDTRGKDTLLARLGELAAKTDSFDPLENETREADAVGLQGDVYQGVWNEAAQMRQSGELLAMGAAIPCPVTAIHGDTDPHPAAGVEKPLSAGISDFHFILLEHCGHTPWLERRAKTAFYDTLRAELH